MSIGSFIYDALPGRVVFAAGSSRELLAAEVDRLDVHRLLLIATMQERPLAEELSAVLGDRVVGVFDEVRPHVPNEVAERARAVRRGRRGRRAAQHRRRLDDRHREDHRADHRSADRRGADDVRRLGDDAGLGHDHRVAQGDRQRPPGAPEDGRLRPRADDLRCPRSSPGRARSTRWRTASRPSTRRGRTRSRRSWPRRASAPSPQGVPVAVERPDDLGGALRHALRRVPRGRGVRGRGLGDPPQDLPRARRRLRPAARRPAHGRPAVRHRVQRAGAARGRPRASRARWGPTARTRRPPSRRSRCASAPRPRCATSACARRTSTRRPASCWRRSRPTTPARPTPQNIRGLLDDAYTGRLLGADEPATTRS